MRAGFERGRPFDAVADHGSPARRELGEQRSTGASQWVGSTTWLRALRTFHSESFDLRSAKDLSESMRDFMELSEGERAFHQAHLTWLQVQALGDVHAALRRLEDQLGQDLRALRKSAAKAADAQEELLDLIEEQRPAEPAPSTPAPEVIEHP